MSKSVLKVFVIIGALVLALVVWSLTFGDGGLVQAGWNGVALFINDLYSGITGSTQMLVPTMGSDQGNDGFNQSISLDEAEDVGETGR